MEADIQKHSAYIWYQTQGTAEDHFVVRQQDNEATCCKTLVLNDTNRCMKLCMMYDSIHDSHMLQVMMYDDIAYHASNPDKGTIINKPNGPNVYPGVPK